MLKLSALVISLCVMVFLVSTTYTFARSTVQTDISYGSQPRQKYDLYNPKDTNGNSPILFFIYGGSWDSGEKSRYSFVGKTFSKQGFMTIIPNYRLFPDVTFPAFVEDAALAFSKVRERFPNRKIFIAGHSAGAQIGALITLNKRYLNQHSLSPCNAIAGFMGLAGPYDFQITEEKFKQIFPAKTRHETQAINFTNSKVPNTLLLHGSFDTTVHAEDSILLGEKLKIANNNAKVKIYNGVGHISIVTSLSPLLNILVPTKSDMIDFMKDNSNNQSAC